MKSHTRKIISKNSTKKWYGNQFQARFDFQRIHSKKESEEVCMLIWIDSSVITYLI